jgi:hypothetical protein
MLRKQLLRRGANRFDRGLWSMKSSLAAPVATADIGVFFLPRESPVRRLTGSLRIARMCFPLHDFIGKMGKFMKE